MLSSDILSIARLITEDPDQSGYDKILFLVHPNMAIDSWSVEKNVSKLSEYYARVRKQIEAFDGPILAHLMEPYSIKHASKPNLVEYNEFINWLDSSGIITVWEGDICENPDDLLDLVINLEDGGRIYYGGGYVHDCLMKSIRELDRVGELSDRGIKLTPIKGIAFTAGLTPRFADDPEFPEKSDWPQRPRGWDPERGKGYEA